MKRIFLLLISIILFAPNGHAQEESLYMGYGIPAQNAIQYNRFLLNPAFSAVRTEQTYLSLFHRNQSVSFDNNNQNYLLGYSGKAGAQSGAGFSVFNQRVGVIGSTGVLANYAYGVKLNDKINFTFGANLAYYKSGYDESRAITGAFDPYLSGLQDGTYFKFQPGFNLSAGAFDFGLMAENLIDYDIKNSQSLSEFSSKIFSGHIQYTHPFTINSGILEHSEFRALARARNNPASGMELGGNLLLDMPKLGWIQAGYDSYYGASTGVGFNLSPQLAIGYLMEKNFSGSLSNLGNTHEITFAYRLGAKKYEDREMLEKEINEAESEPLENDELKPTAYEQLEDQMKALRDKLAQNDAILGNITDRNDSLNAGRKAALNKRFEEAIGIVRQKTGADSFVLKQEAISENQAEVQIEDRSKPTESRPILPPSDEKTVAKTSVGSSLSVLSLASETQANSPKPQLSQEEQKLYTDEIGPVKRKQFRDLEGVREGYYVIANVYKGGVYMQKFIAKMEQKGFQADFIANPRNNLKYVYLKRFETFKEAETAIKSKFDGVYTGELWVMNVANNSKHENRRVAIRNTTVKEQEYQDEVLRKNVVVRDRIGAEAQEEAQLITGARFYIIANVFKSTKNAARFIRHLNSIGLSANYFINPQNKYRYVYLKRHDNWNSALISYYSNLNNSYKSEMWIMRVTPELIA
ncbi:MAG: hypothetical protein RLZZ241_2520 [Bacteroidota bacterium]|jgi:type IX secretion system PorP/SprF family membrane protein